MNNKNIICFPHRPGSGGPGSFQIRFEKELKKLGWEITYASECDKPNLIFVVGGTRKLFWLWKMRKKGVPILYRLDGISWLHKKKKIGIKKYLLAEFRNWSSKYIHAFLADHIIYQSKFVKDWWEQSGWRYRENTTIIHNGVEIPDLNFSNNGTSKKRLVLLEGNIDYTPYAVQLINELAAKVPEDITIELYGKFENPAYRDKIHNRIEYHGFVQREEVMNILHGSVYLSLDINPACPNTVIEAMAAGAPVVGFDTGALPELVPPECGKIVPYGGDPWKLEQPDFKQIFTAIEHITNSFSKYSIASRKFAENRYSINMMKEKYILILNKFL